MSEKGKFSAQKENWQTKRQHYAWHLDSRFEEKFDRIHWWKGLPETEIKPVAALYELARRHPRIGQIWRKFEHASWFGQNLCSLHEGVYAEKMLSKALRDLGKEPEAIFCLCLIGFKSWPTLDWRDRDFWITSAKKLKGLDCRDDIELCTSINSKAQADVVMNRLRSIKSPKTVLHFFDWVGAKSDCGLSSPPQPKNKKVRFINDLQQNPITASEMESAIAECAIAAYRNGRLLISVAPDLTSEKAKNLLEREYRSHLKATPIRKQRAKWNDWLPLITKFEDEEALPSGKKSQAFARYRRAMDRFHFSASSARV